MTAADPRSFPPGLIGIPCLDWMYTRAVQSLFALGSALPPGTATMFNAGLSSPAASRNQIIDGFLTVPEMQSLEWIFFLDADMTPPPDTVMQLLSHNKDVVSAMAYDRSEPHDEMWRTIGGRPAVPDKDGLLQVEAVGGGCLLVARRVLEKMKYPWFESPASPGYAEDYIFCKKVRAAGFPIYLDTNLTVGHIQARSVGKEEALEFRRSPRGKAMIAERQGRPENQETRALREQLFDVDKKEPHPPH